VHKPVDNLIGPTLYVRPTREQMKKSIFSLANCPAALGVAAAVQVHQWKSHHASAKPLRLASSACVFRA
jgi:hypothetical protein